MIRVYEGELDSALLTKELMVPYGSVERRGKQPYEFYNPVLALIVFRKQTDAKYTSPYSSFGTC